MSQNRMCVKIKIHRSLISLHSPPHQSHPLSLSPAYSSPLASTTHPPSQNLSERTAASCGYGLAPPPLHPGDFGEGVVARDCTTSKSIVALLSECSILRPRWKSSNRPPADEKLVSVPREAGREEPPARRLPREFGREERGLPAKVPALLNAGCSPNVAHSADGVVGREAACAGPGAPAVEIVCLWLASRTTKAGVLTEARRPGGPPRGALGVWNAWFGSEVRLVVDALMPRLSDALDPITSHRVALASRACWM